MGIPIRTYNVLPSWNGAAGSRRKAKPGASPPPETKRENTSLDERSSAPGRWPAAWNPLSRGVRLLRMESRVRSLEARRLHAAEFALRSGDPKNSSLIMDSCEAQGRHIEIIETVGLFVSGAIGRRRLYRKLLDTSRRGHARLWGARPCPR